MASYAVKTSDGVVGTSGNPIKIFGLTIVSGGTAAVVSLRNGTAASATAIVTEVGVANSSKTINLPTGGVTFPSGCFCDVDANTTSATVYFEEA